MVSPIRRPRLTLAVAPTAGLIAGVLIAAGSALIPGAVLESWVRASGLPDVIAAAEPPLGLTARAVLSVLGGGVAGMLIWRLAVLIVGARIVTLGGALNTEGENGAGRHVPIIRRADAHPDAPPRAPLHATRELGTPFLDIHAPLVAGPLDAPGAQGAIDALDIAMARDVPDNLDIPLAAFDPLAFSAARGSGHRMGQGMAMPISRFAAGERIETFELTPIVRAPQPEVGSPSTAAQAAPVAPPARTTPRDTEATITALLERLERGVTERADRAPRSGEASAPGSLRRLAAGR